MKRILFVCLNNICRSPLAEGIARKIAYKNNLDIIIDSASINSLYKGESPCESSVKIAALRDVNISKIRSKQVRRSDYIDFDYIVAADKKCVASLEASGFSNIYLLGEFGGYDGMDIPDPYFLKNFDDDIREIYGVYTIIETCVTDFLEKIENNML